MFLPDSRKRPGVEVPPGSGPTASGSLRARGRELRSGLPRGDPGGLAFAITGRSFGRNTSSMDTM